jgi:hypothetical protein
MKFAAPATDFDFPTGLALFPLHGPSERLDPMTKTLEAISEVIRNTKHPFRQVDDRPHKPQKHRYERRKIREYIKLGDWTTVQEA